jgi:hypothetical protein
MSATRIGFTVAAGALVAIACTTDYQLGKDDPAFGDPNALAGQRPPGASSENGSSGGSVGAACVKAGGKLVEAGTCNVSLKDGVLNEFGKAGCASTACHGGTTPLYEPRIEPGDGPAMWEEWQKFTLSNGKPYINPCSTTPADSTIACNVNGGTPCGSLMPKGTTGLTPNIVQLIETWVACGAPNN